MDTIFKQVSDFLKCIGIDVIIEPGATGFLACMRVKGSTILVDRPSDYLAGDVLHEAGHIAVTPSLFRDLLDNDTDRIGVVMNLWLEERPNAFAQPEDPIARAIMQSGEAEAIAWSYAAAHAIGIDTMLPFQNGFDLTGDEVHLQVQMGMHLGINGLVAGGMTELSRKWSKYPFPKMKRWMQI